MASCFLSRLQPYERARQDSSIRLQLPYRVLQYRPEGSVRFGNDEGCKHAHATSSCVEICASWQDMCLGLITVKAIFENGPGEAQVSKDVPKQLTENNVPLSTINAIIWSHSHIDHVGDPSLFPSSACLIHGPGTARPGYPTNPDAFLLESAFTGRSVRQLDFEKDSTLEIRGLNAIDYFNDGSFYILSAAGHTADHVLGLARTGDDEWVLMAADSYHHPGQLRPSRYLRLPDDEASLKFRELLPNGVTEPFYGLPEHLHDDIQKAQSLITKLQIFDADERVLCIIAHDMSMLEDLSLLPDVLNGWKVKGALKETTRWKFLKDFEEALKVHQS